MKNRQGLNVSIFDLLRLAKSLEDEIKELNQKLGLTELDYSRRFLVPIKNVIGKSDIWYLEDI